MEIPANLLISQLKAQRNAALDEVAMAVAQCHHLMEENAKLTEIMKKQEALLVEADSLMKTMVKQNPAPDIEITPKGLKSIRLLTGKKRGRKPKLRINGLPDDGISAVNGNISDTTQQ